MSITYVFDSEHHLLRTRCVGDVTLEDTLEHFREVGADPSLRTRVKALLDLTELESVPDTSQLRGAMTGMDLLLKDVSWDRWAILAGRDAAFGMSRMFQVFLEEIGVQCRVFRNRDEAERWLASAEEPGDRSDT